MNREKERNKAKFRCQEEKSITLAMLRSSTSTSSAPSITTGPKILPPPLPKKRRLRAAKSCYQSKIGVWAVVCWTRWSEIVMVVARPDRIIVEYQVPAAQIVIWAAVRAAAKEEWAVESTLIWLLSSTVNPRPKSHSSRKASSQSWLWSHLPKL